MTYDPPFVYHAKMLIIMMLCIIYLPFSVTDVYFGMYSQEICIIKQHEISMKDYLILAGYMEVILLLISVGIIITPSRLITDKLLNINLILYSGVYTLYTILNTLGMYVYISHVHNTCTGLSEYIFVSLISKLIFTIIILCMICN
jgi:hypothetical protein